MTQMQVETEMEELTSCCGWPEKMVKTEMKEMNWAWEDGIEAQIKAQVYDPLEAFVIM